MRGINICVYSVLENIKVSDWESVRQSTRLLQKHIRRKFKHIMPHKYFILPQHADTYIVSNSIFIEFPAWGSYGYRQCLIKLADNLQDNFIIDIQYHDGKVIFIIRDMR